ncbi:MAG: hypothetical protein PVF58_16705 [Candidatus Methanofastidiosia archaeon]|jgi:hypothetical protein
MTNLIKEINELLFTEWRDLHGKKRYLSFLLGLSLSVAGISILIFVREQMAYEIYQVLILCFIFLAVIILGLYRPKRQSEDKS